MNVSLAGIAGLLSHRLVFSFGEWHLQATSLMIFYCLAYAAIAFLETQVRNTSWQNGSMQSLWVCGAYASCLWGSIIQHRLSRHPLGRFPGPALACVSVGQQEALYRDEGTRMNLGPNELTIIDSDVLHTILDGSRNPFTKPAWYDNLRPFTGLSTRRDGIEHEHRRRVWDQGFTTKALKNYESQIKLYAYHLEHVIADTIGNPVAINQYFYWFSFDVMGQFAFSKSFGMLENRKWSEAVQMLRSGLALTGPFSPVPWLTRIGFDIPLLRVAKDFQAMTSWCAQRMDERIERTVDRPDVSSYLISWSAKQKRLLKDKNTLHGDAIALIIAGSDTTAITLIYIFHHLAQDLRHQHKIQSELDSLASIEDLQSLQGLAHLNGVINETLRLHPAVPTGGLRETPPEGAHISGRFVPGNTVICAPRYSIARLESCFERAHEFIPERWYSRPEMIRDRRGFAPFALGRYSCIGKNLAYAELRFVVALLVSTYDVGYAPGEDGRAVEKDMLDQFTAAPGALRLVFQPRGSSEATKVDERAAI